MPTVLINKVRGNEVTETINFVMEECCNCGIPFFMPKYLKERLLNSQEWFYCPNGHSQHYTGKSESQKKIDELERQLNEEKRDYQNMVNNMLDEKNKAKKLQRQLNRVHKGVCLCCNRTFQNMQKHMETKHPEKQV